MWSACERFGSPAWRRRNGCDDTAFGVPYVRRTL